MTVTPMPRNEIDYIAMQRTFGMSAKDLKLFLRDQIYETNALMAEIDFAIASNHYDAILKSLGDMRPICSRIGATTAMHYIDILNQMIKTGTQSCGVLHYQTRIDNILHAIRMAIYNHSEMFERDL